MPGAGQAIPCSGLETTNHPYNANAVSRPSVTPPSLARNRLLRCWRGKIRIPIGAEEQGIAKSAAGTKECRRR